MKLPEKMDPAKPAFDLFSSPFYLIAHVDFKYHEDLDKAIAKYGLDRATYRLLTVLVQTSPINIKDLAARALIKRSTVSRALLRMAKEGLVETKLSPDDQRNTDVYLTNTGKARAEKVMQLGSRQLARATDGLSKEQLQQYITTTQRMISNLNKLPIE